MTYPFIWQKNCEVAWSCACLLNVSNIFENCGFACTYQTINTQFDKIILTIQENWKKKCVTAVISSFSVFLYCASDTHTGNRGEGEVLRIDTERKRRDLKISEKLKIWKKTKNNHPDVYWSLKWFCIASYTDFLEITIISLVILYP